MGKLPDFSYEEKVWRRGFKFVVGADEVGRGALAGPVVTGVVVWRRNESNSSDNKKISNREKSLKNRAVQGDALKSIVNRSDSGVVIDDSKKLSAKQRIRADLWIKKNCLSWGVGEAPVSFINKYGIVRATRCAFRRAIKIANSKLRMANCGAVDFLLVDAFYVPYVAGLRRKNQLAIVHGDQKSISIAAASIVAKVYRDKLMASLARCGLTRLGRYGWEKNKGYGTRGHQEAIRRWGPTRLHRKLFIRKITVL